MLLLRPDDGDDLSTGTILIGFINFLPVCKEEVNSATASLAFFLLSLESLPLSELGLRLISLLGYSADLRIGLKGSSLKISGDTGSCS